jgi:hypothetical protein
MELNITSVKMIQVSFEDAKTVKKYNKNIREHLPIINLR